MLSLFWIEEAETEDLDQILPIAAEEGKSNVYLFEVAIVLRSENKLDTCPLTSHNVPLVDEFSRLLMLEDSELEVAIGKKMKVNRLLYIYNQCFSFFTFGEVFSRVPLTYDNSYVSHLESLADEDFELYIEEGQNHCIEALAIERDLECVPTNTYLALSGRIEEVDNWSIYVISSPREALKKLELEYLESMKTLVLDPLIKSFLGYTPFHRIDIYQLREIMDMIAFRSGVNFKDVIIGSEVEDIFR